MDISILRVGEDLTIIRAVPRNRSAPRCGPTFRISSGGSESHPSAESREPPSTQSSRYLPVPKFEDAQLSLAHPAGSTRPRGRWDPSMFRLEAEVGRRLA